MATKEIVETVCDVCGRVSEEARAFELRPIRAGQRIRRVDLCPRDARPLESLLVKLAKA